MTLDAKALEALTTHQRQLDMDGVEVGVSRQALDELIAAYDILRSAPGTVDIVRASESLAEMVADWYGNAPLPNARITASVIALRLARFPALAALPHAGKVSEELVALTYTNYKGETATRTITPRSIWFGSTEWHPEPQWLLRAFDHDKQADRDFALKDFGHPSPADAGKPNEALEWEKQDTGAVVATIHEDSDGALEIVKLSDERFRLTVHQRIGESDRFEDCSIELRPTHFAKLGSLVPATSQAKGGAEVDGPVPTYECDFSIGQPVRLANPYAEMDPSTVLYVTGISWEHRRVPAHGWNIMVASKEDIDKGYGQTDGYHPDDLLSLRSVGQETAKEGGE